MEENKICIRMAEKRDFAFILRANEENVEVLATMDREKLESFAAFSELFLVVEVNGVPAAFLIALREGVEFYDSENYRWFSKNYRQFLYIDRIVIDAPFRSLGIGRQLYQEVFARARSTGVPFVTAEIDTVPYNEASLKFHKAMGFKEVGVQQVRGNSVTVSLQEAAIAL